MTKQDYICLTCDTQFIPKNPKKPNKFCCMACYRVYQKTPAYTTDYNRPSRTDLKPVPCANCEKNIVRNPSVRRNGKKADNVYCDRKCYDEHRKKLQQVVIAQCKYCDSDIRANNQGKVYCSIVCRNKDVKPEPRPCIVCQILFDPVKYHKSEDRYSLDDSLKTCSNECLREFYRTDQSRKDKISNAFSGSKHPNWQGGVSGSYTNFRGSKWQGLRKKVMRRDGYKCRHCGIDKDEQMKRHNRMFSINHIVPFHQLSGNTVAANKLSNLETLCDSCHTKADWAYRRENPMQGVLNFGR